MESGRSLAKSELIRSTAESSGSTTPSAGCLCSVHKGLKAFSCRNTKVSLKELLPEVNQELSQCRFRGSQVPSEDRDCLKVPIQHWFVFSSLFSG